MILASPFENLSLRRCLCLLLIGYANLFFHQTRIHPAYENAAGPWPACIGQSFTWCATRIQHANTLYAAHSPLQILRSRVGDTGVSAFQHNRVRIVVNDEDIVTSVPERG